MIWNICKVERMSISLLKRAKLVDLQPNIYYTTEKWRRNKKGYFEKFEFFQKTQKFCDLMKRRFEQGFTFNALSKFITHCDWTAGRSLCVVQVTFVRPTCCCSSLSERTILAWSNLRSFVSSHWIYGTLWNIEVSFIQEKSRWIFDIVFSGKKKTWLELYMFLNAVPIICIM